MKKKNEKKNIRGVNWFGLFPSRCVHVTNLLNRTVFTQQQITVANLQPVN